MVSDGEVSDSDDSEVEAEMAEGCRDRILVEEDNRLELVNRGGRTYFVPATASVDSMSISSFGHWEQSYRVFVTIYTNFFPNRASELIQ